MKPRKHRIFIVGSGNRRVDRQQRQCEAAPEQMTSPAKVKAYSKRKHLFDEVEVKKGENKHPRKQKYQYQLHNHITAESLSTVLNCDLITASHPQEHKTSIKYDGENKIKEQPKRGAVEQIHPFEAEVKIPTLNNQEIKENPHNQTFTSNRVKIFDGINLGEFRQNAHLSSLSTVRRKHLFFRHQSQVPISLNTSISRQRRRIFSSDCKPVPHIFHPILPLESNQQLPPLRPIHAAIKEQDEISRITEVVNEQKMQSVHASHV